VTEHDPPEMDPSIRALLEREGTRGAPGDAKARALMRVTAAIAVGGVTAAAGGPTAAAGGAGTAAGTAGAGVAGGVAAGVLPSTAKIVIALVVGIALGSTVTAAVVRRAPAPSSAATAADSPAFAPAAVVAPATAVVVAMPPSAGTWPLPAVIVATPSSLPSPPASSLSPSPPPLAPPPLAPPPLAPPPRANAAKGGGDVPSGASGSPLVVDHSLTDERRVLDRARMALSRRDATAALAAASEHEASFPRGQLAAEREAILVQGLAMANRRPEAIERAARFRMTYPNSVLTPVVDQAAPPSPTPR